MSLYRCDLFVYGKRGGKNDTFFGGTGVPRNLWYLFAIGFAFEARLL